jgi:hypothetical protein
MNGIIELVEDYGISKDAGAALNQSLRNTEPLKAIAADSFAQNVLNSTGHVPGGAKNIFHYHSLKQTLREAELFSIFEESGVIKSELAKDSIKIILGTELRNPQVIAELMKDGSEIADWGKYTYNIRTSSGTYEVHYYFNEKLGVVNSSIDYKILLPGGGGR